MLMHWILVHLQAYKDAIVAVAALISPFVALFAASLASSLAAWAALRAAEKQRRATIEVMETQTRATVRAANRQNWIDQLRCETAAFISLLPTVIAKAQRREAGLPELGQKLNLHAAKIHLLVTPTDCGCQRLSALVEKAAEVATSLIGNHCTISLTKSLRLPNTCSPCTGKKSKISNDNAKGGRAHALVVNPLPSTF